MDKAGYYRKGRRKLLKHERRKARKLKGHVQEREIIKKNERRKARKLQGYVQEREITKKLEREADIFAACLLGVPFILVVLVVFIFISKPMILMCIIWVIGMLLALAFGR